MSLQSAKKVIEGNWDQFQGKILKQWGELTDKDVSKMNGSFDQLVGTLKEKYGYNQEELEKKLDKVTNSVDLPDVKKIMQNSVENIKEQSENAVKYVRENPMKSVFMALAAGIVLAKVLTNSKN